VVDTTTLNPQNLPLDTPGCIRPFFPG